MNPESQLQSRLLLQCLRPNGQDQDDPVLSEALQKTLDDAELRQWLEAEQAFDRAFANALASVPPPAGLPATLLAGAHASRRAHRWQRTAWVAVAACVAVAALVGLSAFLLQPVEVPAETVVAFRDRMIATLEGEHQLDLRTPEADAARVWLASHGGIADPDIPPGLGARETIGCKVFEWHGAKVTLICFRPCPSGDPQSASAHLFVVKAQDAPAFLHVKDRLFAESEGWSTAAWEQGGKVHLLLSRSAMPHLQDLFEG